MEPMYQINFRVGEDEKEILEKIARAKHLSLAELSKRIVMKELGPLRVEIAFDLLKAGKIGKKRAFTLSGLSYREFLGEAGTRGVTERMPEGFAGRELEHLRSLDINQFLKSDPDTVRKPLL